MKRQSQPVEVIESVYHLIRSQTGKIRLKDIIEIIGSREKAHYAIVWLTRKRKIKRVKGFGEGGIEYFYHDLHQGRARDMKREGEAEAEEKFYSKRGMIAE